MERIRQIGWIVCAALLCVCLSMSGCGRYRSLEESNVPSPGESTVVLELEDLGEVRVCLLEEDLPEVEYFIRAVESGAYEGIVFDSAQKGEYAASSTRQEDVKLHFSGEARHLTGAVSLTADGGLRVIDHPKPVSYVELADSVQRAEENGRGVLEYSQEDVRAYQESGGLPELDGVEAVIGYVYDGMEKIHRISTAAANPEGVLKQAIPVLSIRIEPAQE